MRRMPPSSDGRGLTLRFALATLVLFGAFWLAANAAVTRYIEKEALHDARAAAEDTAYNHVIPELTASDFDAPTTTARAAELDELVRHSLQADHVERVKLWSASGQILYSDHSELIGSRFSVAEDLAAALSGSTYGALSELDEREHRFEQSLDRLFEIYIPVRLDSSAAVVGALELYYSYAPIAAQIATAQRITTIGLGAALLLLFLTLVGMVHRASSLIRSQRRRLSRHAEALEIANHALRTSERRWRALVLNASDVVFIVNRDSEIRYVGPSVERLWGFTPADLAGSPLTELLHDDDANRLRRALASARPGDVDHTVQVRVSGPDGDWLHVDAGIKDLTADVAVGGIVLNCRNVTEHVRLSEQLAHSGLHDPLTDLPNRALFLNRAEHAMATVTPHQPLAALVIDIDRFRMINESLGHAAGDRLLVEFAGRLNATSPSGATVARTGGDEFGVLLPGRDAFHTNEAVEAALRILDDLRRPVRIDESEISVDVSIGIAVAQEPGLDARQLLRDADVAMYQAKAGGGSRFALFDPALDGFSVERVRLHSDLRRAVERNELRLRFQPIVDLQTREMVGVEALVRWQHPERGLLGPADFITLAEETGEIVQVGRWVLREACRQVRTWHDWPDATVHVNLSAREFAEPGLVEQVSAALSDSGLGPERLELELTESVLFEDTPATLSRLWQLKTLGVRLSIDDFGKGFASFDYLRRLPVDTIKIDRSFVMDLPHDARAIAVVEAMMSVASSGKLDVTAEGIETHTQWAWLGDIGCPRGQGFLFAPPLTADGISELVTGGCRIIPVDESTPRAA